MHLTLESTCLWTLWPSWPLRQLTVNRTLHNTGDVHLPLFLQIQLQQKMKGSNTWHMIKITAELTQSVMAGQQFDLKRYNSQELLFSAVCNRLRWPVLSASPEGLEHWGCCDAVLTQCVFVNEPDDEAGQRLNSWGDSLLATITKLRHIMN